MVLWSTTIHCDKKTTKALLRELIAGGIAASEHRLSDSVGQFGG